MAKVGRNQPCPCGSGKKYKQCCLATHDAARIVAHDEQQQRAAARVEPYDAIDRLDDLSNGAVDLIDAGRLDEAERMCRDLLREYPDVIDGDMRLGHLYRVRGDAKKAAEHLRLAAAMARSPDYDPEVAASLDAEADALDPPSA